MSRSNWDPEVAEIKTVDQISDCVDLCQIRLANQYPQPSCEMNLICAVQTNLENGACAMLCESVSSFDFPDSKKLENQSNRVVGRIYEDHIFIEPLSDGLRCRIYLLSRVDLR